MNSDATNMGIGRAGNPDSQLFEYATRSFVYLAKQASFTKWNFFVAANNNKRYCEI